MLNPAMKILLVDDSKTMRMIVKKILCQIGFNNIHEAKNGKKGLEKLKNDKGFNLVLSDWTMPGLNGLDFLKAVRKDEELSNIGFIMISAESIDEDVEAVLQQGANAYLTKPFKNEELQKKIESIFLSHDKKNDT